MSKIKALTPQAWVAIALAVVAAATFIAGMIIHWLPTNWKRRYRLWFSAMPLWLMVLAVCLGIIVIYQFVTADMQPFRYFQF